MPRPLCSCSTLMRKLWTKLFRRCQNDSLWFLQQCSSIRSSLSHQERSSTEMSAVSAKLGRLLSVHVKIHKGLNLMLSPYFLTPKCSKRRPQMKSFWKARISLHSGVSSNMMMRFILGLLSRSMRPMQKSHEDILWYLFDDVLSTSCRNRQTNMGRDC